MSFFVFGCFSGGGFGILGEGESPQEIAGNNTVYRILSEFGVVYKVCLANFDDFFTPLSQTVTNRGPPKCMSRISEQKVNKMQISERLPWNNYDCLIPISIL